jgi:hypothetical protein
MGLRLDRGHGLLDREGLLRSVRVREENLAVDQSRAPEAEVRQRSLDLSVHRVLCLADELQLDLRFGYRSSGGFGFRLQGGEI